MIKNQILPSMNLENIPKFFVNISRVVQKKQVFKFSEKKQFKKISPIVSVDKCKQYKWQ